MDDVVDDLDSRHEISYVEKMMQYGTGADRQLKVYEETKDLKAVVDMIARETIAGVF